MMTSPSPTRNLIQASYDEVPYESFPFPQSHPDRLASVATMMGMQPAPVTRCRVLELGCAGGGNLIPMAYGLPHSEFVGLDFSPRQIAEGQKMVEALDLGNISLKAQDILTVEESLGQFDYIIAHGVYSWVPPEVQDKLLEICGRHLAPQGVAYVSYNTYPGWRMQEAVRDMLRYHTQQTSDPHERITQARELLDFLAENTPTERNPHANFLHAYLNFVNERFVPAADNLVMLHNELAEINQPVYFHQFAGHAAGHGLKFLAEADFRATLAQNLPAKVLAKLRQFSGDVVSLQQYLDFLQNRTFRQTLLCHQVIRLKGKLAPERLPDFAVASCALPEQPDPELHRPTVVNFRAPNGDTLSTDHPVTKAAMLHLSEQWPQAVPFPVLIAAAYQCLGLNASPAEMNSDWQLLATNLLRAYGFNEDLVEFRLVVPPFVRQVSERPVVSPLARYQASQGDHVTNMRHEVVKLEGLSHALIPYLDGSWSRAALLEVLAGWSAEGVIEVSRADVPSHRPSGQPTALLPETLEQALASLANAALLVA
jgi:methyltransferase-like protein/2-polyprenyl-3-methyl-5-hydroxy-6-metoxy-1,4-benzoquinol methylase